MRHPPPTHTTASSAARGQELPRRRSDQLEERDGEGDERQTRQREQHQAVHRDAAEHREDAVPRRGEGSDHTNNSAVLPGDHSTRPSVVIRTHCTPHSCGELRPAVEEQRRRDRVRPHRGRCDRPRRRDRAHRLAGARIEHVVQPVAPRAAVRRRGAERGIRHLDDRRSRAARRTGAPVRCAAERRAPRDRRSRRRRRRRRSHERDDLEHPVDEAPLAERADVDDRRLGSGVRRTARPPERAPASLRAPAAHRGRRTRMPRRTRALRATPR